MDTKKIALTALLAAVYALGNYLHGFPMIGVPGKTISLVRALEMGYGIILGPVLGPFTSFLGAVVGKVLTGGSLFFTPLAIVSALMASTLYRREVFKFRGWIIAAIILSVLIIGWYATRTGRAIPYYPIMHFAGLGIILSARGKIAEYLHSDDRRKLSIGVALCSYPSTIAGHMLGNLLSIYLFKLPPIQFMAILPVSALERIILTILSTIISTPLIIVVRSLYPDLLEKS